MKKILSILICIVFGISSAYAAVAEVTASVTEGEGFVAANKKATPPEYPSSLWGTENMTANDGATFTGGTVYAHAKATPNLGYAFSHWVTSSGNNTSNPYKVASGGLFSKDNKQHVSAVFYPIISTKLTTLEMPLKIGSPKTVEINYFKATGYNYKITKHGTTEVSTNVSCTPSAEPSTTGSSMITYTILANNNAQVDDQYDINFSADNGATLTLTVTIIDDIKVTFKAPKVGGYYDVDGQDDSGSFDTRVNLNSNNVNYTLDSDSEVSFKLTATTTDNAYRFSRWKITNKGVTRTSVSNPLVDYSPNNGDEVEVEFVETTYALFQVLGGADVYSDLTDGLSAAAKTSKVLMVCQDGFLKAGDYEIPAGITLLVPGTDIVNNQATYRVSDVLLSDFASNDTSSCKRHLKMQPNTKIDVYGNISVYAVLSKTQPYNGKPITYGRISMADQCHITLHSGSVLSTLGYITGNPTTSSITAKADAMVYEVFQISDWRGGGETVGMAGLNIGEIMSEAILAAITGSTVTADATGNAEKVFPIGQYYIQNIETKLILEAGAVEKLTTAVDMSLAEIEANAMFIVPGDFGKYNNAYKTGLFRLGEGSKLIKYYDKVKDRQCFKIQGSKIGNTYSTAEFDRIDLVFNTIISGARVQLSISSSAFTLPITNNLDIEVDSAYVYSKSQLAFLAGSTLKINNSSKVFVESEVYIYDKEQNTGYFYTGDSEIIPVRYTPDGTHEGIRPDKYPTEDATWTINGELQINSGGLYTTYYTGGNGKSTNVLDYGAKIISTGNGKVTYNEIGESTLTYQHSQVTSKKIPIPITNAQLSNDTTIAANKLTPYSAGSVASEGDVYTYVSSLGKWLLPQALTIARSDIDPYYLTLPKDTIHELVCIMQPDKTNSTVTEDNFELELKQGENSRFKILSKTYGLDSEDNNYKLRVQVKYLHLHQHNLNAPYKDTIVVKCKDLTILEGDPIVHEVPVELVATEDYKPNFSVKINGTQVVDGGSYDMSAYLGQSLPQTIEITPVKDNVATLSTTQWTSSAAPSQFNFEYGAGVEKLTNAQLVFTPTDLTPVTGTLVLTATYMDGASNPIPYSYTITLNATADKQPNSLAFIAHKDTIIQGGTKSNIFANLGSGIDNITNITYDGENSHELVELVRDGDNYKIVAKEVESIVQARTVTIEVTQQDGQIMYGGKATIQVTILPLAIWHWSKMYFDSTYVNPLTPPQSDEEWSLNLVSCKEEAGDQDDKSWITLDRDYATGYYAMVSTPSDVTKTYKAIFHFMQGEYEKDFESTIYADPRILPYCVDTVRTYNDVTTSSNGVSFDDVTDGITFNPAATWEFEMIGVPGELTFTPAGSNTWMIQEYNPSSNQWTNVISWTQLIENQPVSYLLKPTTTKVAIKYGENSNTVGTITNLCVEKLVLSTSVQRLYLPVNKDDSESVKSIVLTHTSASAPMVSVADSKLTLDVQPTSNNLGSATYPYYTTEVQVETNLNTPIDDEIVLTATSGDETIQVVVRTYEFPQGLPICLATDNPAERFYFVTTDSMKYAQWNETKREIVFTDPGASYITRYLTFAFEGAPSIVKFKVNDINGNPLNVDDVQWVIKESVDGNEFFIADEQKRDSVHGNSLVQGLGYQTRYVLVEYAAMSRNNVVLSDFVIEGYPQVLVEPLHLKFDSIVSRQFTVKAINLESVRFELDNSDAFALTTDTAMYNIIDAEKTTITIQEHSHNDAYTHALGKNKVGDIVLGVKWLKAKALDEGNIRIYNASSDSLMAVISLLGADNYLVKGAASGIYTGIPDGTVDAEENYTYHGATYKDYKYHQIDLTSTFATDSTALFDYLFIYGETTTTDGKKDITEPKTHPTLVGSNALTPLYVYRKALNTSKEYKGYEFVGKLDNVNVALKDTIPGIIEVDTAGTVFISDTTSLKVYMTGFCPYATTGYTKNQEGVFLFRGKHGAKLDIYLENFHVFSRNKTQYGNAVNGKEGAEVFTDGYARGSGSVLVFENMDPQEQLQNFLPFEVTIHTKGNNYLSSNNGCFFGLSFSQSGEIAMKATQVSSPIYVHMYNTAYARKTKTTLNFTDEWPEKATMDAHGKYTENIRTNGFLALKKQSNNAPSIDLGNKHTEVNFWGGQVELQNSQIGSDTYKTTLAISHRSGYFGADGVGIQLCYGLGTDSVGGTVNFYDGTVTVRPMKVAAAYRQYYLMDVKLNAEGDTVREDGKIVYSDSTSCLRLPMNTYVQGGSHSFMRACQHVTSKGGAPKDAPNGKLLGQYVYTMQDGKDTMDETTKLATITGFPGNITGLSDYHGSRGYTYGLKSVTPDGDKLYFWIPDGFGGVTAEEDKLMSTWKACMTEIAAGIPSVAEGRIGGDTPIEQNEEVKYFLYCKIDNDIKDVIRAGEKNAEGEVLDYTYLPPFEVPSAAKSFFGNATYARYDLLTYVSDSLQYQVVSDTSYTIMDRVYYITTATADIWQTFTAPFNVANIYVMETYPESKLEGTRSQILKAQAAHNADFAAFFAVAMAMGTFKDFEGIYDSYIEWAKTQDAPLTDLWDGTTSTYTLRGKQRLIPYVGSNWRDANFYLNENKGNWTLNEETGYFDVNWETLTADSLTKDILLHKGRTYSLMFPYCPNCEEYGNLESRTDWDYWSGKFLIFESTAGAQVINGRDFLNDTIAGHIFTQAPGETEVVVTGNSTFARLETDRENLYVYESGYPIMNSEMFLPPNENAIVQPTTAFLYGYVPNNEKGMPAKAISRSGQIIYDNSNDSGDGTTTGGNIPTVGGGNDLFITSTATGINVAVAQPQQVRVMSATGAIIYSGMVQTAVDVLLPTTGVYVITGENEVHKILH